MEVQVERHKQRRPQAVGVRPNGSLGQAQEQNRRVREGSLDGCHGETGKGRWIVEKVVVPVAHKTSVSGDDQNKKKERNQTKPIRTTRSTRTDETCTALGCEANDV